MRLLNRPIFLSIIIVVLTSTPCFSQDRLLEVTGETVNIRVEPNTSSTVVTQAVKGDVFKLIATQGNWFEISMFSGEYRYIHNSLARETANKPAMPSSEAQRRRIFVAIVRSQDRAVKEAEQRFPRDFIKQIDFERLLYDRYEMAILHQFKMAPALHTELILEGIEKNWIPRPV